MFNKKKLAFAQNQIGKYVKGSSLQVSQNSQKIINEGIIGLCTCSSVVVKLTHQKIIRSCAFILYSDWD
jgi:hypothetical protein